jgi:hypothetical protein
MNGDDWRRPEEDETREALELLREQGCPPNESNLQRARRAVRLSFAGVQVGQGDTNGNH